MSHCFCCSFSFSFLLSHWIHSALKSAYLQGQRRRKIEVNKKSQKWLHGLETVLSQPTSRLSSSESRQRDSWMWRKAGAACRGGREPSSSSSPLHLELSRLAADDAFVVQRHAAFHRDGLSRRAWRSCWWMTPEWKETNGSWSPAATPHIWAPAERLRDIHLQNLRA